MNLSPKTRRVTKTVYVDELSKEPVRVFFIDEGYTGVFYEFHDMILVELYKGNELVATKDLYPNNFAFCRDTEQVFRNTGKSMIAQHKKEGKNENTTVA